MVMFLLVSTVGQLRLFDRARWFAVEDCPSGTDRLMLRTQLTFECSLVGVFTESEGVAVVKSKWMCVRRYREK